MKKHLTILASVLCLATSTMIAQTNFNFPVQTSIDNGVIEGNFDTQTGIQTYFGVPFAKPPVGQLRWKAPQPIDNWTGVKETKKFGPRPLQAIVFGDMASRSNGLSEDCLYLNVWTSAKAKKEKQAVFVWIYGGGLSSGSANCAIYDGEEMAKKGVVFVSINYRVGVFGFMAHPELSKESGTNASGNYGFLDQIAALKWVQKNIVAFGGDPNNVTIAGQSAGAFSVTAMIASPLAKGLFHKAIPQSGGLLSKMLSQNLAKSEESGLIFMKKANANNLEELRKKSADELQKLSNDQTLGRFGVTMDGYVLPTDIFDYFKKGMHNQTPVLAGWVTGDGSFFGNPKMSVEDYKKEAQTKYGDKAEEFLSIFPASTEDEVKAAKQKVTLIGFAGMPSHLLASFNSKPTYMYQFSHIPPDKPNFPNFGAFHTSEVPYTLHTLHTWKRPWQQLDRDLENTISSYWVNFAKTGNPNGANLPEWKTYDKQSGNIISLSDKVELKAAFLKKEFDFLEDK